VNDFSSFITYHSSFFRDYFHDPENLSISPVSLLDHVKQFPLFEGAFVFLAFLCKQVHRFDPKMFAM